MVEANEIQESTESTPSEATSENTKSVYKKVRTLGKGAYGIAFLVKNRHTKKNAVIKTIDTMNLNKKDLKSAHQEAKLLESLDHPNIIHFIEVYKQPKKNQLCIVMDYAEAGDLQSQINARKKMLDANGKPKYLTEDELLKWFT